MNTQIDIRIVKEISQNLSTPLVNISNVAGAIKYFNEEIDCSKLDTVKHLERNIIDSKEFEELFKKLNNSLPILYIFEINSDIEINVVRNAFEAYSIRNERVTPAIYKNYISDSKILYVGKVLNGFKGRLIVHLGVANKPNFHGLQLLHWAKSINLHLKLHIFEFNNDMNNDYLMLSLEGEMAKMFKPIVGKH